MHYVDKETLREDLLAKLKSLPGNEIASLSYSLTQQLIKFFAAFPDIQGQIGASYLPLSSEVAPVYQELLRAIPLSLAFPILKDTEMAFGIPNGLPKGKTWLEPPYSEVRPNWFLVPGVAFTSSGARLGRGKGFYDRYFEKNSGLKIGLAWSEQVLNDIPVEAHDSYMDFIITEKFCWNVKQQKRL